MRTLSFLVLLGLSCAFISADTDKSTHAMLPRAVSSHGACVEAGRAFPEPRAAALVPHGGLRT